MLNECFHVISKDVNDTENPMCIEYKDIDVFIDFFKSDEEMLMHMKGNSVSPRTLFKSRKYLASLINYRTFEEMYYAVLNGYYISYVPGRLVYLLNEAVNEKKFTPNQAMLYLSKDIMKYAEMNVPWDWKVFRDLVNYNYKYDVEYLHSKNKVAKFDKGYEYLAEYKGNDAVLVVDRDTHKAISYVREVDKEAVINWTEEGFKIKDNLIRTMAGKAGITEYEDYLLDVI